MTPIFTSLPEAALNRPTPARWKPRKDMGRRLSREGSRLLGWERDPAWVGRPGKGLTPFVEDDPRVELADCTHTQIKDINGAPGPVSRCLDCGGLITTALRVLMPNPEPVTDEALDSLRQEWNNAHWGAP